MLVKLTSGVLVYFSSLWENILYYGITLNFIASTYK
jgi:hypothetical protein